MPLGSGAPVMFIRAEVLGTGWYSKSGRENDDDTIEFADGSTALMYDPKTKTIKTSRERGGDKRVVSNGPGGAYVVV